jgi:hypothetical protein
LERCISTSWSDVITFGCEEDSNIGVVIKFTPLIQVYILVLVIISGEYCERKKRSHLIGEALEVLVSPHFMPVK